MKKITYRDLQYPREDYYFSKLKPTFEHIKKNHKGFGNRISQQEESHFNILSSSVKIDQLKEIKKLIADINSHLEAEFDIDIFLYQSAVSNAMCIPHYSLTDNNQVKKLIVLVSQHFFNNLSQIEQTTILGHELAHLLFGHVMIPTNLILQENFNLSEVKDLKSDVLKWSICCEITCDIFGYISNNRNKNAFSTAMLKYTTGLHPGIFQQFGNTTLIDLVLDQFEDLSNSIYEGMLTTHPLTPLRLKIIENISNSELVQNYGTEQPEEKVESLRNEYSQLIDNTLDEIYPELIQNRKIKGNDILLDLSIAVSLSDGKVSREEIDCIGQIISEESLMKRRFAQIKQSITETSLSDTVSKLILSSIEKAVSQALKKSDVVNIVRQLIIVAASDSVISKDELKTIYQFSKEFNISKQEIVLLSKQLGF